MPVLINLPGMVKLKEIGVDGALLAKVSTQKGSFEILPQKLVLKLQGLPGDAPKKYEFQVYAQALLAAAKGNLPKEQIGTLRYALNDFIKKALDGSWTGGSIDLEPEAPVEEKPAAPVAVGMFKNAAYSKAASAMVEHEPLTNAQINVATTVPLADAKGIYRPVRGTDSSSKYFLLGVFDGFKLGGRLNGAKLSLRVEGPGLNKPEIQKALKSLGFTAGNPHWSTHLMCTDTETAQRYVGTAFSVLPGLLTPIPDLKVIAGKGVG